MGREDRKQTTLWLTSLQLSSLFPSLSSVNSFYTSNPLKSSNLTFMAFMIYFLAIYWVNFCFFIICWLFSRLVRRLWDPLGDRGGGAHYEGVEDGPGLSVF